MSRSLLFRGNGPTLPPGKTPIKREKPSLSCSNVHECGRYYCCARWSSMSSATGFNPREWRQVSVSFHISCALPAAPFTYTPSFHTTILIHLQDLHAYHATRCMQTIRLHIFCLIRSEKCIVRTHRWNIKYLC